MDICCDMEVENFASPKNSSWALESQMSGFMAYGKKEDWDGQCAKLPF